LQVEDLKQACDAGERALQYFPDSKNIYLMLGADYTQMKNYDKAMASFNKALELTDSLDTQFRSQIVSSIGDLYYAKGERDSAFEKYDEALELDPGNLLALNNCAYYLAESGKDLDKAERMSAITIKEKPDDATSLDTYAWIMFKKGSYVEAKLYIDRAIDNAPEPSAELFHHAGDIYFWNKDPEAALDYWKKALELEPDNALLQRKVKHKTYFYQ
jgi:tetratricopeptide (TPR) repeat protein